MGGLPLLFIFQVYQGIYTGLGDTKGPMRVNIYGVLLNIVLDPILIFGWGPVPAMGVGGAALATVLARGLTAVLAIPALLHGPGLKIKLEHLKWDNRMAGRMMRVALPLTFGHAATSLGFTLLIGLANGFGSAVVAAFGVGHRVTMMIAVPTIAMSQANAAAVGQNLGAGQVERAVKAVRSSALLVTVILLPLTILTFFFGHHITHWFIADPEVIAYGADMFTITSFSVFVFGLIMVLFSAFSGSGHTVPVMVVNISRLWVVRIPAVIALTSIWNMGPESLWWAMNLSNLVAGLLGLVWFMRGGWKKPVIEAEGQDDGLDEHPELQDSY
jgi:putative MATE family efflux protein